MDVVNLLQRFFLGYKRAVMRGASIAENRNDIVIWKNRLFVQFLLYCFPVSLIALVPGLYMSFKFSFLTIGIVDSTCFVGIVLVTFSRKLSLKIKKAAIVSIFYVLSIFLITSLGYIGPGIFYLMAITMFISLFFSAKYAYFSVLFNLLILTFFGFEIAYRFLGSVLSAQYTVGGWIAFGSNLIFLSIVLVALIEKMFNGLQTTIEKKEQNKAKYKSMFEHSPMPMWLFDPETYRFIDVNKAAIKLYGYSKKEFLTMTMLDIRPCADRTAIEQVVKQNRDNYKFYDNGIIHLKKNGEKLSVKVESSKLEFNSTKAKLVLVNDITEQVKNEERIKTSNLKVKQSELNLRAIFESAIQGFVLLDSEHRVIVSNPKANESIILDEQVLEFKNGLSIFDFIEESKRSRFNDSLIQVSKGEIIEFDRRHTANGKHQWIHYTLTPVYENGIVTGTCITGHDVTEIKKHIETIERQNKKFREISWIQSHLVRAPLARIMGLNNLIISETNENEKAEMMHLMQISANELNNIILDITNKSTSMAHRIDC